MNTLAVFSVFSLFGECFKGLNSLLPWYDRGPLSKLASMIPGMSDMMGGNEEEASKKMSRFAFIFDSMTTEELDSDGAIFRASPTAAAGATSTELTSDNGKEKAVEQMSPREPNSRVLRVARGSGTSVNEVEEVLSQHQMFAGMVKQAGGKSGWLVLIHWVLLYYYLTDRTEPISIALG
jgi:signal recognition particle subunit SRP54